MEDYVKELENDDSMKRNIAWGRIKAAVEKEKGGSWDDFIPLLVKALDSEHDDVVKRAVSRLGRIKERSAVDKLISLLSHPDHWLKVEVIKSLGLIGDPKAFNALVETVEGAKYDCIGEIIEAIARMDTQDSWEFVKTHLRHEFPYVRETACRAVERANYRQAIPTLLTMLDDMGVTAISPGPAIPTYVRDCVFDVLGKMKAKEALPVLKGLLEESANKGEVHALIEHGGSEVIGITTDILVNGTNSQAKANSASILRQILMREKADDERIGPALMKGLQDENALVRRDSCFAVSETQYNPAIPLLVKLVDDKTDTGHGYTVDHYALYALGKMKLKETIPFFKELLVGKNEAHRAQATMGLIEIGGEEVIAFAKDLAANHKDKDVRYRAVNILGHLKEKEFLRALLDKEKNKKVREQINLYLK